MRVSLPPGLNQGDGKQPANLLVVVVIGSRGPARLTGLARIRI
jgi:hypothetical protein